MKICLILLLFCPFISAGGIPAKVGKIIKSPNIGLVTFPIHKPDRLIKLDKQRLLDIHNALRNYLAKGNEKHSNGGSMPTAANMQALSWDDKLATYSQNWANQCKGTQHSALKGAPLLADYTPLAYVAENLSGGITAQERDMYGEVQWWNYKNFECRSDKNCGHYLAFANAQFTHVGCGYKECKVSGTDMNILVCVYGGNNPTAKEDGKDRLPYQHEYLEGTPCSKCQQGWDYCMGGGLCATKKQCQSSTKSKCVCNHKKDACEGNGGTFDEAACTCSCPAGKMGINCGETCANTNSECDSCDIKYSKDAYLCEKECGSCGKSQSAAYIYSYVTRNAPNSDSIEVRPEMEDIASKAASTPLGGDPNCKNVNNGNCQLLRVSGYCERSMRKLIAKEGCKRSCGAKCPKVSGPTDAEINSLLGKGSGIGSGTTGGGAISLLPKGLLSGLGGGSPAGLGGGSPAGLGGGSPAGLGGGSPAGLGGGLPAGLGGGSPAGAGGGLPAGLGGLGDLGFDGRRRRRRR